MGTTTETRTKGTSSICSYVSGRRASWLERTVVFAVGLSALLTLPSFAHAVVGGRFAASASNPAGDLDQCANGPADAPTTTCEWINGNLGASKAHYREDDSVPFRL